MWMMTLTLAATTMVMVWGMDHLPPAAALRVS
jgi:hypothetical protein